MLDQMFTAENLRRIFDMENRKGFDVATKFFPHLKPKTDAIRDKISEIRSLRKQQSDLAASFFLEREGFLKAELKALKDEKSDCIDQEMNKISINISSSKFKIAISQNKGPGNKPVYCIDGTAETFFAIKHLQHNINRIYGVRQANRHDLACRIRDSIVSGFPFELVRTDISNFYENIDRRKLYAKLEADQLLSSASKKFVRQIFDSYGDISGSEKGIPRGVGVSAYLAELFLRPIDHEIAKIPGIVLYCRYVDDIVAIFARPPTGQTTENYKDVVFRILSENELSPNEEKTVGINFEDKENSHSFEYLGYRYTRNAHQLTIAPSDKKVEKLKGRLCAVFELYDKTWSYKSRQAFRLLAARIKFLTGNTRLSNSKSGAKIGIYYSNSLINDFSALDELDAQLRKYVKAVKRKSLRKKLARYQFKNGFLERRFHKFSSRELEEIVGVWKHAEA